MNLWLFVIAAYTWWFHYHLDQIQSQGNPLRSMRAIQSAKKYHLWIHYFVWVLSAVFTFIPLALNAYGIAGTWCWLHSGEDAVRLAFWYIPLWIGLLFMIGFWVDIMRRSQRMNKLERDDENYSKFIRYYIVVYRTGFLYILMYCFCWTWPTVSRLYELFSGHDSPPLGLQIMHALFGARGFGYFGTMIFLYTIFLTQHLRVDYENRDHRKRREGGFVGTVESFFRTGMRRIFSSSERHDQSLSEPAFSSRGTDMSSMNSRLLDDDALQDLLGAEEAEIARNGGLLVEMCVVAPKSEEEEEDRLRCESHTERPFDEAQPIEPSALEGQEDYTLGEAEEEEEEEEFTEEYADHEDSPLLQS
eukprot:CAMPEP_0174232506 /NCGR_PEP_ID=MMETSP0417-20130205/2774_1 /TAXON_ID=242541 /ORGANISM="Mayorella sp, Strain BSH-02190019" /LENGTH=359 /DNA_ID=CAMNT_0015310569 /DNA_START=212 /DNA_END=1291 /DNA_ORIENTATION=+